MSKGTTLPTLNQQIITNHPRGYLPEYVGHIPLYLPERILFLRWEMNGPDAARLFWPLTSQY